MNLYTCFIGSHIEGLHDVVRTNTRTIWPPLLGFLFVPYGREKKRQQQQNMS